MRPGSVISKCNVHKDPAVEQEFRAVYQYLERLRVDRAIDPRAIAKAIGPYLPSDVLFNIERYLRGERDAKRLHFKNDRDSPTIKIDQTAVVTGTTKTIDVSSGAHLTAAGAWNNACSRDLKANFADINSDEVIRRIRALKIQEWEYKACPEDGRHMGPMAQDFYEKFGLGPDEKTLNTVDLVAVALIAIQSLASRLAEVERRMKILRHKKKPFRWQKNRTKVTL